MCDDLRQRNTSGHRRCGLPRLQSRARRNADNDRRPMTEGDIGAMTQPTELGQHNLSDYTKSGHTRTFEMSQAELLLDTSGSTE